MELFYKFSNIEDFLNIINTDKNFKNFCIDNREFVNTEILSSLFSNNLENDNNTVYNIIYINNIIKFVEYDFQNKDINIRYIDIPGICNFRSVLLQNKNYLRHINMMRLMKPHTVNNELVDYCIDGVFGIHMYCVNTKDIINDIYHTTLFLYR